MNSVVEAFHGNGTTRLQYWILRSLGALLCPLRYRFTQRVSWKLGDLFSPKNSVVIKFQNNRKLKVYLNDGYWIQLLFPGFEYEKDVMGILEKLVDADSALIDCGANIGYWSTLLSERIAVKEKVVAIEPVIRTFSRLSENSRLNQNCFVCIQAAISENSGTTVTIVTHDKRHAGDSIVDDRTRGKPWEYNNERIQTLSLDDILKRYPSLANSNLVLKLDIEGAEVNALKGAEECLKQVNLIIYEETHSGLMTRFLIERWPEYKLFRICKDALLAPLNNNSEGEEFFRKDQGKRRKFNLMGVRKDSAFYAKMSTLSMITT